MAQRRSRWKKWIRWSLIALFLGFIPTFAIIIWRTWLIDHPDVPPAPLPNAPVAENQFESHTCGLHALRSLYRAYGVNPYPERLRDRLGADFYAVFWNHSTTGTFHADIYMVLAQDRFAVDTVDLGTDDAAEVIASHLESGHLAMFLIERRENGHLHWVLASASKDENFKIVDSLADHDYWEPSQEFVENHVVSALLVQPSGEGKARSSIAAHLAGSGEIIRFFFRLGKSKEA